MNSDSRPNTKTSRPNTKTKSNKSARAVRTEKVDVLVVGGGPAGASVGARLADSGHDVLVLEKKRYPREKTCGDGLTPRSVKALMDLGMESELESYHQVLGLRAVGYGYSLELPWPEHSEYPKVGMTVPRSILDRDIAERARKMGATIWEGSEALAPEFRDGILRGARVRSDDGEIAMRAAYVVVADGSLSRFGRALGTSRDRTYPMGLAVRGYYNSPRDGDPWIESRIELRHRGEVLPAYGWVFPIGDGTVNVGAGLMSTYKDWKDVNTSLLMEAFVAQAGPDWGFDEKDLVAPAKGGKLPMGISISPRSGVNWIGVGDAIGAINPFNGEGIAYAMETAEVASELVDRALKTGNGLALTEYYPRLYALYGPYYRAGRIFGELVGNPKIMEFVGKTGMRSRRLMQWVLMVFAHLGDPKDRSLVSRAYFAVEKVAAAFPPPG